VTLKPGLGVTQGHRYRHRSIRRLWLPFHSNRGPISYGFRGKRRFQLKIANFSSPVHFAPSLKGFPWNWLSALGDKKKLEWWAIGPRKKCWHLQPSGYNAHGRRNVSKSGIRLSQNRGPKGGEDGVWGGAPSPPLHQLEGLGSAVSSPAGSGKEPQSKLNLVHITIY